MDNITFGRFIASLRAEKGLTQSELAQQLQVTNKAVSKWETGRGFPDIQLLEPLGEALGVSVAELLRGERLPEPPDETETNQLLVQAMQDTAGRVSTRVFRILKWICLVLALVSGLSELGAYVVLLPHTVTGVGVIGGADGPTAIFISYGGPFWLLPVILLLLGIVFGLLERKSRKNAS